MPRRVVTDTNVLIAALRSRNGASAHVLREVQQGTIQIELSLPLYLQYVDVAARHIDELRCTADEAQSVLAYLSEVAAPHDVYFLLRPGSVDPRDEMLLELAVKSQAEFIVTYNVRHFGAAEKYGVRAVQPIELLKAIGAR